MVWFEKWVCRWARPISKQLEQGICCYVFFSYFPFLTCFYFVSYPIKYLTRGVCVGGLDPFVWNNQSKMGSRVHWRPLPFSWRRLIMFTLSLASVLIIWEQLFWYNTKHRRQKRLSIWPYAIHMTLKSSTLNIIAFSKTSTFDTITSQFLCRALKLMARTNFEQSEIIVFSECVSWVCQ